MGKLVRMIAQDASCVCTVLDSTDIVNEMREIHQSSATVTAALGRLITAASITGSQLKNEQDSVTIRMNGAGPAGSLIAVSDSSGNPRGYVANPAVELPLNNYGKLDVAGVVGTEGFLSVIKDVGLPEPSTGSVPIVSGEIAEDMTQYFAVSEQIPTVCALGVLVGPELQVQAAGGYLIQMLPGAGDGEITRIEQSLADIQPVTAMLSSGMAPEEIAVRLLRGFETDLLDEAMVKYVCNCSKQRVERALISVGKADLQELSESETPTEVDCHFCNKKYVFSQEELRMLLKKI